MEDVLQESTTLRADVRSARAARRFLRAALESWRCDPILDLVLLAANELVTNAVRHAHTPEIGVRVILAGGVVRVEVTDGDPHQPVLRQPADDATGGRGMAVVD
ncbi:MAG TPA: ATP-binding protein, partial [Acidimicrobiales bacterium]